MKDRQRASAMSQHNTAPTVNKSPPQQGHQTNPTLVSAAATLLVRGRLDAHGHSPPNSDESSMTEQGSGRPHADIAILTQIRSLATRIWPPPMPKLPVNERGWRGTRRLGVREGDRWPSYCPSHCCRASRISSDVGRGLQVLVVAVSRRHWHCLSHPIQMVMSYFQIWVRSYADSPYQQKMLSSTGSCGTKTKKMVLFCKLGSCALIDGSMNQTTKVSRLLRV